VTLAAAAISFLDQCQLLKSKGLTQEKAAKELELSVRQVIRKLKNKHQTGWSKIILHPITSHLPGGSHPPSHLIFKR